MIPRSRRRSIRAVLVLFVCGVLTSGAAGSTSVSGATALTALTVQPARSAVGVILEARWGMVPITFNAVEGTVTLDRERAVVDDLRFIVHADREVSGNRMVRWTMHGNRYLAIGRHPQITFLAHDQRVPMDAGEVVDGEMTMRGVTRPLRLTLTELTRSERGSRVRGSARINLQDFGISGVGAMVRDELEIEFDVLLVAEDAS